MGWHATSHLLSTGLARPSELTVGWPIAKTAAIASYNSSQYTSCLNRSLSRLHRSPVASHSCPLTGCCSLDHCGHREEVSALHGGLGSTADPSAVAVSLQSHTPPPLL